MKNLETLIQELCPDGVEFVKLGEVCEIKTGKGITQKDCSESSKYPVYSGGKEPMGYYKEFNRNANTVTVSRVGAYAGFVNYVTEDFYLNDKCFSVLPQKDEDINSKYLYYKLKALECSIINMQSGGGVPTINTKKVGSLEIPLPPIEVQTEIVRILDKFTPLEAELEMELEAELDCRKRQYEYYRDKLLSFDNEGGQEVEWKKMSEVSFYPKTRIDASELSDNSYIGVENLLKDKLGRTDFTVKPEGSVIQFIEKDILIGNIRPYLRKIWKSDCKGGTNGDVLCIRVKEPSEVSPDYLFHILSSEKFFLYDIKKSKGAKMPRGDKAAVMNFEIPIPSLEEQHSIVSILDRFESLTTALQSGLPAEIAARRQQYEHYRDKLLTFKRKGAA